MPKPLTPRKPKEERAPKLRANGEGTVFQRADGRWVGRLTVGVDEVGRQKTRTVYGRTQQEARQKLRELQRAQEDRALVEPSKMTVSDLLDRWLESREGQVKGRTMEMYRYEIEHYIKPEIGKTLLQKLSPLDVEKMKNGIIKKIKTNPENTRGSTGLRTAAGCRRTLHSALEQAILWELIPKNPVKAVKPPKPVKRDVEIWELQEVKAFLAVAEQHRLYALFYLALSTGMRQAELLGLKWEHINMDRGTLHVRESVSREGNKGVVTRPKNNKTRLLSLGQDSIDVLKEHQKQQELEAAAFKDYEPSGLVFTNIKGGMIDRDNLNRIWYLLRDKTVLVEHQGRKKLETPVKKITFHALRHTHASMCIRSGMDPKSLSERLGHATASFTLDVYSHVFLEQRQQAVSLQSLLNPTSGLN